MLSSNKFYDCGPCNKLYKKEVVPYFNQNISVAEDLLFNFEIYFRKENVSCWDDSEKYFYYYRSDSACHSLNFTKAQLLEIDIWENMLFKISNSNNFKQIKPFVIYSMSKVIWASLFKLAYLHTSFNGDVCPFRPLSYLLVKTILLHPTFGLRRQASRQGDASRSLFLTSPYLTNRSVEAVLLHSLSPTSGWLP